MRCALALVEELRAAKTNHLIVLATDNMDCFWRAVPSIKDLTTTIDAVLCSSQLGVLKKDSVESFFGPWLRRHNLDFRDALLLDDTAETCETFRVAGGAAIVVTTMEDTVAALREWRLNPRPLSQ